MTFIRVAAKHAADLMQLQRGYKKEIGERSPSDEDFEHLLCAIADEQILFFGCLDDSRLVACCSVSPTFSTFNYRRSGVFEDFYILPEYRHRGIARKLVEFAYRESGVGSLTVGCADCDIEMYKALGFCVSLGTMLAFDC